MKLTKEQFMQKTAEMAINTGLELNGNQLESDESEIVTNTTRLLT